MRTENNPIFEASPRTAARVLYLSSFLKKDKNVLYVTQRTKMKFKHLSHVLGIGQATTYEFVAEAERGGLLVETDDGFTLPCFSYKKNECGAQPLTLNQEGVRALYKSTPTRLIQYVGYVLQACRYINSEWSIMCHNPLESELEYIEPMTLGEFCDAIGYHRSNAKPLVKNFRAIAFPYDGKQQNFCIFVAGQKKSDMRIFVNPNIMYTGKHPENVEALGAFF